MKYKIDEVLEFLQKWRSAKELCAEFQLTDSERFNLCRWLRKAGHIEMVRGSVLQQKGLKVHQAVYFYKILKKN